MMIRIKGTEVEIEVISFNVLFSHSYSFFLGIVLCKVVLQVSANTVAVGEPLFSESFFHEYFLSKDDFMMNSQRNDNKYPVYRVLNINGRTQNHQIESEQHWISA